ncbi:hypothetical protein K493DRAFT_389041 [Basidiobolus meristosporus CBS 931.73]|uniref:Uncharacterized protein n=1 Tax=Basidiobolus meristosporus CBS 931.73 TaxID=1314790 RepID=A0A1Y1YUP5_9FUNG|nr:hypothetical protein K493DRAFT_389041 [Basidiobolus meristosporus CBS 931.73]|eukprot:ORY01457.1 hypothetical protein K493DRAFT_389041 [Basidiobolus meristosporus CBS 931.73]
MRNTQFYKFFAEPTPRAYILTNSGSMFATNLYFAITQKLSEFHYAFAGYWSICALLCFVGFCGAWRKNIRLIEVYVVYSWVVTALNFFLIVSLGVYLYSIRDVIADESGVFIGYMACLAVLWIISVGGWQSNFSLNSSNSLSPTDFISLSHLGLLSPDESS